MSQLDKLHMSTDISNPPTPGETVNLLGSITPRGGLADNERLSQLLANLSPDSFDETQDISLDDIDDNDIEEDIDIDSAIQEEFPSTVSSPTQTEPGETEYADNEEETQEDHLAGINKTKLYIIAAVLLVLIIIVVMIVKVASAKSKDPGNPSMNSSAATVVATEQKYSIDMVSVTDTQTYQDLMTIDKYIVLDKDACLYVFDGYAENARAFVKAYVDRNTYNIYRKGAKVAIIYEHITLEGKDYYMNVRVIKDEE